ncbi:MAG: hypothetical protein KDK91_09345 [Gammaproteobacteria bacterium]|nr:hypothetical protein [Gammaproteobacteria bacterium]
MNDTPKTLVTLELAPEEARYELASALPVLRELDLDAAYGLVTISPKRHLYVLRVRGVVDRERLLAVPQVKGVHGDVRISTTDEC